MNTQTVTSIMFRTWSRVLPSPAFSPQKSAVNRSALNPTAAIAMNVTMGTILAMVTRTLAKAALRTPLKVRACTAHSSTEAPTIAGTVVPPSNPPNQ